MNAKQKIILICSAVVIVFLSIFPPFLYVFPDGMVINAGYSFFYKGPPAPLWVRELVIGIINIPALLAEYLGVVIIAGLLTLAFKEKK